VEIEKYADYIFDLSSFGWFSCTDPGLVKVLSLLFISTLNNFEVVVTDRLHIGIASALLKKEVYLLDNSYGKVSGVYKRSMADYDNVKMIENLSQLEEDVGNTILQDKNDKDSVPYNMEIAFNDFLALYFSAYNPNGIVTKTFLNEVNDDQD
jgi:hypothetical protein